MIEQNLYKIEFLSSGGKWQCVLTVGVDMDDKTAESIARDYIHNGSIAIIDWEWIEEVDDHEIFVSGKEV
jgi:hypothetical protein